MVDAEVYVDRIDILSDIRAAHRRDATTADGESFAETVSEYLQAVMSYEGSPRQSHGKGKRKK